MARFQLTLEYEGSGFEGWQRQPGGSRTVQGVLEEALLRVTGDPVRVVGASRTDAGVHAEAQVAHADLEGGPGPERLLRALNGVLPPDVAVRGCEPAAPDFHARRHARAKLYRYRVWNGAARSPLRATRSHWVPSALDLGAMREAAAVLAGPHDFASFMAAGTPVRTTQRTLARLEWQGEVRGELDLWVEGDAFLRHMVRILAGTMIEVGLGRRAATGLPAVLAARSRAEAGRTAPALGLTLVRVQY